MQEKKQLLDKLYERDGHMCHYCRIQEGDFSALWGKFYGLPYRGTRLELDRKDAVIVKWNDIEQTSPEYTLDGCVLACALCNMAKSNMFTHEEFHEVGKVVEEIWQKRKLAGLTVK